MKPSLIATMIAAGIGLAAAPAIADTPNTLGQQGRLFDGDGVPIEGQVSVVYALYGTATGGTARWSESQTLTVKDGYFATTLGRTSPIEMAAFADGNMFLTVKIEDDSEMMPRAQLVSVPFALVARDAVGDIHPKSVSIGDQLVIDEEGQWVGDIIGLQGEVGPEGPQGDVGPAGPAGLAGATGPMCPKGPAGLDGATGPMGPQGPAGLNGLDGATGPMGPQGPAGLNGLDGATGPMGPQGPAGLLTSGSQFGNTPYWNGGFWVTDSNNLFNNGGSIGIGTSSPGAKLDVVGNVRIADGTQGDRKVLMSDGNGNASWIKMATGYVLIGDVASGISTAVGGDMSFASKSNSGSSSTITVNFEDQGNTNFVPMISLISLGTADDDNDVETPVVLNVTSTSIDIFLNETNGTTQDLRINVVLIPF